MSLHSPTRNEKRGGGFLAASNLSSAEGLEMTGRGRRVISNGVRELSSIVSSKETLSMAQLVKIGRRPSTLTGKSFVKFR